MTTLLIDLERRSRRRLYALLQRRGEVRAVDGVFAAFHCLRRHLPDVVVVKTSGHDALALALLKWLALHGLEVPTIVLLEHSARREAEALHRLGARHILRWPTSNAEVLRSVSSLNGQFTHPPERGRDARRSARARIAACITDPMHRLNDNHVSAKRSPISADANGDLETRCSVPLLSEDLQ